MKNLFSFILVAVALVASAAAFSKGQTYYKWHNEKGVLQYTDTPPPDGIDFETIDTYGGVMAQDDAFEEEAPAVVNEDQGKNGEDAQPELTEEEQANADKIAEQRKKDDDERCKVARKNYESLTTYGRVTTQDEKGEERVMTPEEQAKKTSDAKKVIDEACK